MRKPFLFTVLLCSALLCGGCKKKETIDLSSLHTKPAVEKESLPENQETDSDKENDPAAETKNSGKLPESVSVVSEIKTYEEGQFSIEYPVLSNMKDSEKETQINDLLKKNALRIMEHFKIKKNDSSVSVKASVESLNLKRIVVSYRAETSDKRQRAFYTNTIDLNTGEILGLSDYADPYTVAGYLASGDYKHFYEAYNDETNIRSYINQSGKNTDYYYKLLKNADFSSNDKDSSVWPDVFTFEKQGTVYVGITLPDELGGYAIAAYNPDNK